MSRPSAHAGPDTAASVAQVLGRDGLVAGAGFLVADRLLVTCAHVVAAAGSRPGYQIDLMFPMSEEAEVLHGDVLAGFWRAPEGLDVAFVRIAKAVSGAPPLILGSVADQVLQDVHSFGFPAQAPNGGHYGYAKAGRLIVGAEASPLLQLSAANDLTTGFSGAPVVDDETGLAIGMVTSIARADEHLRGVGIAYATPTQVLQQLYPDLELFQDSPYRPAIPLGVRGATPFYGGSAKTDLLKAADDLADRVGRQWRDAAMQRGLHDRPLAVRWTWSPHRLSGPASDAVGDPRGMRMAPLPGVARTTQRQLANGDLNELFPIYGGLDSGRILLAGTPGSGKSGALIRLLLDALKHRGGIRDDMTRAVVPVPVILTAYDWAPGREELVDWVTRRLEAEHPFLKARDKSESSSAGRAMVDAGLISVMIDGLDEMPDGSRSGVLRRIGREAHFRVVVSSRIDELAQSVVGGHLAGAAALELSAVSPEKAAEYLRARVVHPIPAAWQTLIQRIREGGDDGDGANASLAQAMDSPLMLSLLLDTYPPFGPVDELTDTSAFPSREKIEDHLLAKVVPTAYTEPRGRTKARYTAPEAELWLGILAAAMQKRGTRDLAWWRIAWWLPSKKQDLYKNRSRYEKKTRDSRRKAEFISQSEVPMQYHGLRWNKASFTGIRGWLIGAMVGGFAVGLAFNFVRWFSVGLQTGVVRIVSEPMSIQLSDLLSIPLPTDGLVTPVECWRGNRRLVRNTRLATGLVSGLVIGPAFALAAGLLIGLHAARLGLGAGIYGALMSMIEGTGGVNHVSPARIAFRQLRRTDHGPAHMMEFLEDARSRGVLRTVGPVYQFRHARLQDVLAASERRRNHADS